MSILADPSAVPPERQARSLYWRGWGVTQIAEELGEPRPTVESWRRRGEWDKAPSIAKLEDCLESRWMALVAKQKKTGEDYKEIDLLGRQVQALARVRRYEAPGGHEGDLNENVAKRNAGERKPKKKPNHFTAEQAEKLREIFLDQLFGYQETWWANLSRRTRMILKSRQIGATYYFAFEALMDAIESGRNQIFLSASKAQAHQFRNYIIGFAKLVGVDLKGDPMLITSELRPEGEAAAELHFLGTNFRTAQGRSGNFYFDEFFWVHGFEELNKVASGMATHKRWRKTYFSTPSTVAHPAYPYWTGERRNRRRKKEDRIEIDVSHAALKDGRLGDHAHPHERAAGRQGKAAGLNGDLLMSKRGKVRAMSRAETVQAAGGALVANDNGGGIEAFSFGEPESVIDRRTILDMLETYDNGRWYEPPVPLDGLARAYRASPHHSSAIQLKRNLMVKYFAPTPILSTKDFTAAALDFLIFGNAYFVRRTNRLGGTLRLEHVPAKYVRRGVEPGVFWWVPNMRDAQAYEPGQVLQIRQPDINQELYGLPEYLSALQSALLNEAATLFRRRYYLNGSHAGFILYATGEIDVKDTDALKSALKQSKGPGNFRNLFVHAPNGKEGSIKLLPIAEVGAKDEFLGIKNVTAQDMLAAHRTPPAVLGIVPAQGSSGFGNPHQAADMFFDLEIEPLQVTFREVNDWLGSEVVRFRERVSAAAA